MVTNKTSADAASEVGADQVQAAFDEANAKGYFGECPDKTPLDDYTLKGVTSSKKS